ncbi:hypothetical protein CO058_03970 [candidate division WWE3 bacterium CG_4_9_14_0_2_um_filter_35_11]|uniref:Uncharacterized protein n=1 Tax=candidate division WWE3 bacterium CG_4_9_14_0_2_um_filter_35_11 TaxID=1975077 RepID=A0A2M8EKT0_UNCKA|nr:MAG: hypothetical protein COV25_04430 [candidate division WWE3 bacterium CG10_big_fil_rev_8_21_14_0_10_35_32]PJC23339.1 MAG: hypothetical protein CO058_03970 [candidate division WWE3 bacterium CG_4_9_14_0_2_um_filter_35_11]
MNPTVVGDANLSTREGQIVEGVVPVVNVESPVAPISPTSNIQRYPLNGLGSNVFDVQNPKARVGNEFNPDTQASLSRQVDLASGDVKSAWTWNSIMTVVSA